MSRSNRQQSKRRAKRNIIEGQVTGDDPVEDVEKLKAEIARLSEQFSTQAGTGLTGRSGVFTRKSKKKES